MTYGCDTPQRDGDRYSGNYYELNEETGVVSGCPAQAREIIKIIKAVKMRSAADGSDDHEHALPMLLEDLTCVMQWSETVCPQKRFSEALPTNVEDWLFVLRHGLMQALKSTAFTLWTR